MNDSTLTSKFVVDTMGLVLRIEQRRLGPMVRPIFDAAESGNATIYVPSMVFAEILYLFEKRRSDLSLRAVVDYLKRFPNCKEYPQAWLSYNRQLESPISPNYTTD